MFQILVYGNTLEFKYCHVGIYIWNNKYQREKDLVGFVRNISSLLGIVDLMVRFRILFPIVFFLLAYECQFQNFLMFTIL